MADLVPLRDLPLDRRRLIGCAALFGISGPLLAACSSGSSESGSESASSSTSPGETLVAAADVPVGGGVVLTDLNIVVTQPKKGEFLAFDSRCTHQGSTLSPPKDGILTCPLHGSQFSVEGENLVGPNGEPAGSTPDLPSVDVEVDGGDIVRA